ncbi:unnamed protein product, partial [Amoebophrya sp. A120]
NRSRCASRSWLTQLRCPQFSVPLILCASLNLHHSFHNSGSV